MLLVTIVITWYINGATKKWVIVVVVVGPPLYYIPPTSRRCWWSRRRKEKSPKWLRKPLWGERLFGIAPGKWQVAWVKWLPEIVVHLKMATSPL